MVDILQRRSALENVYKPGRFGAETATPGLGIAERRGLTLVHVEHRDNDAASPLALSGALGCTLPPAGHSATKGDIRALWLGPSRWLITAPDSRHGALVGSLAAAAPAAAVNDVSSSRTVLRLSGPRVRDVLAAGCPLDLDASIFTPGMAAGSLIDHFTATLDCIDTDTIDVYVARGYAVSFWEWLLEAGSEYGIEVQSPLT